MLQQIQHKRFTMQSDLSSLLVCYWCVQQPIDMERAGDDGDGIDNRPEYIDTGM